VSAHRDLPPNFFWLSPAVAGSGHPGWSAAALRGALAAVKQEGIRLVVSLAPLDAAAVAHAGLAHAALEVPDMGVPDAGALGAAIDLARSTLARGEKILVHCGAGYGRTGTFLACLLVTDGVDPEEAMRRVREKRPGSIETRGQEAFVRAWGLRVRGGGAGDRAP
jgi:atypical dual specificity phosphatase